MTPEGRFWSKVDVGHPLGCWQWTAALSNGYGHFGTGKHFGTVKAHRIAYLLLMGEIPDGYTLDHLCRNRRCVNPDHLGPVTAGVNILRGYNPAAKQARQVRCHRGHTLPPRRDGQQRQCRACNAETLRRFRKAGAERLDNVKHGRESTYSNYGCRCEPCREAAQDARRARRARRERGAA